MYVILIIILIILIVIIIQRIYINTNIININGGAKIIKGNIVVDVLNLTNYLYDKVEPNLIIKAIKKSTKILKNTYTDRIMFVLKDRDFNNTEIIDFEKLAKDLQIYIFLTKKYDDTVFDTHSSLGRDDFYCIYLANKFNCAILTNDNLRDYKQLPKEVDKFKIIEFNYYKPFPIKDYINPYGMRLKSPKIIKINTLL